MPARSTVAVLVGKECLRSDGGFLRPCLRRFEVFVVAGGQARLVATANLDEGSATAALSPDGQWLAVGSQQNGLSLKQLPP